MSFLCPTYNFWWQFNSFYQLQPYLLCCCCRGGGYTRYRCPQCLLSPLLRLFLFFLSLAFIFLPLKDSCGYAKLSLSSAALCFWQLCGNGLLLQSSPFSPCVHFLQTIAASHLPAFGSTNHPALMKSLVQKMKRFGALGVLWGASSSRLLAVSCEAEGRPLRPGSSALRSQAGEAEVLSDLRLTVSSLLPNLKEILPKRDPSKKSSRPLAGTVLHFVPCGRHWGGEFA